MPQYDDTDEIAQFRRTLQDAEQRGRSAGVNAGVAAFWKHVAITAIGISLALCAGWAREATRSQSLPRDEIERIAADAIMRSQTINQIQRDIVSMGLHVDRLEQREAFTSDTRRK
jgi:hypothetical protein